ncbi:hypothetical protein ACFX2A_004548 [Malus domestica]
MSLGKCDRQERHTLFINLEAGLEVGLVDLEAEDLNIVFIELGVGFGGLSRSGIGVDVGVEAVEKEDGDFEKGEDQM